MENTKIEWCDHTGNIWHGCTEVHAGCDHCYAGVQSHRWGKDLWGSDKPRMEIKSFFINMDLFQKKAAEVNELKTVFVGSMMDIFERSMPVVDGSGKYQPILTGELRQKFFGKIDNKEYPNLILLLLTKRPSNIPRMIPESWIENPPSNVMYGTSLSKQDNENLVQQLLKVNGKHFLSLEPQISEIELRRWLPEGRKATKTNGESFIASHYYMCECLSCGWIGSSEFLEGGGPIADTGDYSDSYCPKCENGRIEETENIIDWVIQGGESGAKRRPFSLDWAYKTKEECFMSNTPYFFKQIDKVQPVPQDLLDSRQFPTFFKHGLQISNG